MSLSYCFLLHLQSPRYGYNCCCILCAIFCVCLEFQGYVLTTTYIVIGGQSVRLNLEFGIG
jgi:hypothetical protein